MKWKYIIICGKIYYQIIKKITGFNLYCELEPLELRQIHEKMNEYIHKNEEQLNRIKLLFNENYENIDVIEIYVYTFSSNKISLLHSCNIETLCKLFKMMAYNNLWLISSY